MEAAFQCTTCGACEFQCPVGIQHLPVIVGLRRGAVNTGKWEDDYGGKMFLAMERNGNSLGFASSERLKFIEKNELPIYDGTQEYCLWLGCMGSYDPQGREIVLSLVRVLRHLGITFGVLRKEKCTGDPVRRLGQRSAVPADGRSQHRADESRQRDEAGLHLPALRAHHRRGLEGIRRGVPDRASQRIAGPHAGQAAANGPASAWYFTIRAIWAATAASTTSRAQVIARFGRGRGSAARPASAPSAAARAAARCSWARRTASA